MDDGVLVDAVRAFADLVEAPDVVAAWTRPSVLEGYSVGGIAGHVLSLVQRLSDVVGSPAPDGLPLIPYVEWYGSALTGGAPVARLIDLGEDLSRPGPTAVAAALRAAAATFSGSAAHMRMPVALVSMPGRAVPLRDFLRTRVVEVVVHADGIMTSVGRDAHELWFDRRAWDVALGVLVEVAAHADPLDAVRALARPARRVDQSEQQFALLAEISGLLEQDGVDHWLGGGWAVDFHVQRMTRSHSDVDLVVRLRERDQLIAVLTGARFTPMPSDTPDAVQTFDRDGVDLEVTFVVETSDGTVITPGFEDWPWLPGACSAHAVEFRGLRIRAVSAEALLDTKLGWVRHVGEDPRPHDLADIETLRHHLGSSPRT